MATYNSVSNPVVGVLSATTRNVPAFGSCPAATLSYAATSAGNAPVNEVREYAPSVFEEYAFDPSKGQRRNFEAIKKSGQISMTPLTKRRVTVENFVVSRHYELAWWRRIGAQCAGTPTACLLNEGPVKVITTWDQSDHIDSLPWFYPKTALSVERASYEEEIRDAISSTQQAAFASAMSTYDVLTELAESKDTLRFLTDKLSTAADSLRKFAHTDEPTHRRARSMTPKQLIKSSDKLLRKYGSRWMEYRYALMPLLYSFKDVNELLGQRNAIFKTSRDKEDISLDVSSYSGGDIEIYQHMKSDVKVRSTLKLAYDGGALQRLLSQSSFNVFKTGLELIPFSFVAEWFLNLSDAIVSATAIDFSSQRVGCTSVRRSESFETKLFDSTSDTFSRTVPDGICPGFSVTHTYSRSTNDLLQKVTTESYDRSLFSRPEPEILLNPYLNWKRFLDGLVLSHKPIKQLLRSL